MRLQKSLSKLRSVLAQQSPFSREERLKRWDTSFQKGIVNELEYISKVAEIYKEQIKEQFLKDIKLSPYEKEVWTGLVEDVEVEERLQQKRAMFESMRATVLNEFLDHIMPVIKDLVHKREQLQNDENS